VMNGEKVRSESDMGIHGEDLEMNTVTRGRGSSLALIIFTAHTSSFLSQSVRL
jgi:hypothetical protein